MIDETAMTYKIKFKDLRGGGTDTLDDDIFTA